MGERCRKNPHPGATICTNHGLTEAGRAKAAEVVAEEQASKVLAKLLDVDATPVTDSVSAMRGLAGQLRSVVDAIGQRLDEGDLDGPRERAWIRAVRELRQLLADMERLGIAGRELEWKQGQAQVVVSAVMSMLEFVPVEQRDQAVRGALEALGIEDDDVVLGVVVDRPELGDGDDD